MHIIIKITIFSLCFQTFLLNINLVNASIYADNTLQCGYDWHVFEDKKCFKVIDSNVLRTNEDAVKTCNTNEGSGLVSIHSAAEQTFFITLLYHAYHIRNNVWIGAELINNTLKWFDNTRVDFSNIDSKSLDNSGQNKCLEMSFSFASMGKWLSVKCDKKNVVICQKWQNPLYTYFQTQIQELNMTLFTEMEKNKIELTNTKNEVEKLQISNDFLYQLIESKRILMHSSSLDKTNLTYYISSTNNELSLTKTTLNRIMENIMDNVISRCDYSKEWIKCRVFVDQRNNIRQVIYIPENRNEKYTWDNGMNVCKRYNSSLITIQSVEKQRFLESYLEENRSFVWTSGHRNQSGKWVWSNGNELIYTNWRESQPNNYSGAENCVHIYGAVDDNSPLGSWNDIDCESMFFIVCEFDLTTNNDSLLSQLFQYHYNDMKYSNELLRKQLENNNNKLINTIIELINTKTELIRANNKIDNMMSDVSTGCLTSDVWIDCKLYIDSGKNIRQVIAMPKNMSEKVGTWDKAVNVCAKYNSSLVSIQSFNKQRFFETYGQLFAPSNAMWISGRKNSSGNWTWINGDTFSYTKWASTEPKNLNGGESCACYYVDRHTWYDHSCDDAFNIICEFNLVLDD